MVATRAPDVAIRLLHAHLRRDAPLREASIARYMAAVSFVATVLALLLGPVIGWGLSAGICAITAALAGYYFTLLRALKRGWYHPAIPWVNVAVEVSAPALIISLDLIKQGPVYAAVAPPTMLWGALITLSALRASRTLAFAAGAMAMLEYLAFYFFLAAPHLPDPVPLSASLSLTLVRALFLLATGFCASMVAGHLLRKSEEALRSVREQDLMGKYVLHDRVGSGGMAEVFKATYCPEGGFEKTVAVKRVLPAYTQDDEFIAMFREEAKLGALLNHPNIVQTLDVGSFRDTYFLALEFVHGLTLRELLKARRKAERPLPFPAIAFIATQLGAALDYAHQRTSSSGEPLQIVHRDLNPPNVMASRIGEVKLTDFGIARAQSVASVTRAGVVRGKAAYMAPEQVDGVPLDGRADLFALGLTLHELITGEILIKGASDDERILFLMSQPLPRPSTRRLDTPPDLEQLVMDLLEKDRNKRIQSGAEVVQRARQLVGVSAPFPQGQVLLARAVTDAMLAVSIDTGEVTAPKPASVAPEDATQQTASLRGAGGE